MKNNKHSLSWEIIKELSNRVKFQRIIIIVLLFILFLKVLLGFSGGN